MRLKLRHKINGAILITFIVIGLIFVPFELLLQSRHSESIYKETQSLLQMVVNREQEVIASEIYQGLIRAITLRLDQILEQGKIYQISVYDRTGRPLVSRGPRPETQALSEKVMERLSTQADIHNQNCNGIFSMVLMQKMEVIGEPVGFIRICYSLEAVKHRQHVSMIILGALLASIFIVMLILLNLIMSRTVVKPILSLSEDMDRMRAGKVPQNIYQKSKDEIGMLSAAFNRMARDLTTSYHEVDLKRTQLLEAQKYLSNIINSMPSVLLGVDEAIKVTQWNLQAERITGITFEKAIGKPLTHVLPQIEDNLEMVHQALQNHIVRKVEEVRWEISGKIRFMDITIYPLITSTGQGGVILVDDVTDRMRTQEALRESQEKYRLVVENANDGIIILQDGVIKFANPQAEVLSGYTAAELPAVPFINYVSEEDRALVMKNHALRLEGGPAPRNYSFRIKNKSGKQLWINTSSVLISWNHQPATLNFLRDITEQKRAGENLLHAQKLEAIGTLAGGIAHDFNNLLQVIQGYAQLLLFDKKDRTTFQRELESIMNAARKGGELTMQLLTFGRKVESHPKPVDINLQIEKTEKMLSRTIPKMIEIQLQLAQNLPTVYVDPGQIEQVVMNLVLNARDAMPERGKIEIETEAIVLDEEAAKNHLVPKPGEYVRISVSDTGQGISEDLMDHIFDPFFTTKKMGDGTGLGLAIVYGIVKNHNGSIQCYSVPGKGTTFKLYFPAFASSSMPSSGEDTAVVAPSVVGGKETILLVDDEETLRDIGRQLLEKFGYQVLTASNAEEAIEIYSDQHAQIHLVILDLVMPGMGGVKCIDELVHLNPEAKIIIASGYFVNGDQKEMSKTAKTKGFIKKPFVLEGMLHEVRRVLDAENGALDQ